MDIIVQEAKLIDGEVYIPASKSHSIRAIFIAGLAKGKSIIKNPLFSKDVMSAVNVMKQFGAKIDIKEDRIEVEGVDGNIKCPEEIVDVGNSGTTLRFAMLVSAQVDGETILTGDFQIQKRPVKELVSVIRNLGGRVEFLENENCVPIKVTGKIKGGYTDLDAFSSQYLSSALISCPLLKNDTQISVTRLNEKPYVDMTLWWLDKQNIRYKNDNYKNITIYGNQSYKSFSENIAGDYSSATFFIVLSCISKMRITLKNLDIMDRQGDKEVLNIVKKMGANVTVQNNEITVCGGNLKGITIDMNKTPDALPALAVLGCFCEGETRLTNVEQARYKETDRIHVMYEELKKLGANIEELQDGLVIKNSKLHGGTVLGHHDHRIVMALVILGLCIKDELKVTTAEAIGITFPNFFEIVEKLGGKIKRILE